MKFRKLLLRTLEDNPLIGIFSLLPGLFFDSFPLESIQTFKHVWLDKDGLHAHLQLSTSLSTRSMQQGTILADAQRTDSP